MKMPLILTSLAFALLSGASLAQGNSSGSSSDQQTQGQNQGGQPDIGITVQELDVIVEGWSAKKDILNKPVFNDAKQRIGKVEDIIITPDEGVSFAIIGVGGFLGIGRHDVAIPVEQIDLQDGRFVLPGASKEALKSMPKFDYKGAK